MVMMSTWEIKIKNRKDASKRIKKITRKTRIAERDTNERESVN